ncbi:hypothetical protein [Rhodoferax sp.]|uniref:hypothetical protein n=1 Tax=Rhodoferax sp. TaxID=50421 RepID=UPI0025CCD6D3|nr:hypothetical protein [Rhodoferax sp.]
MTFSFSFSSAFAKDYANFPPDQQDKVDDFTDTYLKDGFTDWTKFPGKITYSWKGLGPSNPQYIFTKANELWHYHIGIPIYVQQPGVPYQTSDWVLHFQWRGKGNHIDIVDLYQHYTYSRAFYIPPASALVNAATTIYSTPTPPENLSE